MTNIVWRKIKNKSDKELKKIFNGEIVTIPVSSEPIQVQQGLAFFLIRKFPNDIELLSVDEEAKKEEKPEPLVKVAKVKKTEKSPKGESK